MNRMADFTESEARAAMRPVNLHEALGIICKCEGCWGILLSVAWSAGEPSDAGDWLDHLCRAAPVLGRHECAQIASDGDGFLLFDTEAKMLTVYESIVGDDGTTPTNSYSGPCRVYALTADPSGRLLNENT